MAEQNDDFSLPQPPPPAPVRREAAIEEALRRFDAGGETQDRKSIPTEPRRFGFRSGISSRPQLGILVAASLVAVIGLPLAWLTVTQKTERTELASRDTAGIKTFDVEERGSPAVVFEPETTAQPPVSGKELSPSSPVRPAEPEPETAARRAEANAAGRQEAGNGRQDMALAQAGITAAPAMIAPPPPAAAPAPPAMAKAEAPAATESRERFADARDVVVTAQKRRGTNVPERGDWNACTIDDPKQSLAACKPLVNPGAKGNKGQAAAHLADGLSLAWQGNIDGAIVAFDQAIAINPKSSLAYLNRGLAWRRKGDDERALADLDQAVKLAPSMARGYYNRSLLLRERGEERPARADQARAVDLDPDYQPLID